MKPRRILLCGLNWIGDNVMAMPAVQAYRRAHPDDHLAILVKRALAPLWHMHAAPDRVLDYDDTHAGTFEAGRDLRREGFDACYVLPHSFRSAWLPFLARIPERIGLAGGFRDALLTRVVRPRPGRHQQFEYLELLAPDSGVAPEPPRIEPPARPAAPEDRLVVAIMPGAARGPAKRWPANHFAEVARRLATERHARIEVFGAASEQDLCELVARAAGPGAENFAGRTTLPEWAARVRRCRLAICNDSGGMHLAVAVGTPVVAVYGLTDPAKTGPLGLAAIIRDEGTVSRDIPRTSDEAARRLAAIAPDRVFEAATNLLDHRGGT